MQTRSLTGLGRCIRIEALETRFSKGTRLERRLIWTGRCQKMVAWDDEDGTVSAYRYLVGTVGGGPRDGGAAMR